MLSSLIIVFREMLEASLIVGILMAATRGLSRRGRFVTMGCTAGVAGALLIAYFTEAISGAIQGMGQEIFNASVLFLAALMIGWHVIWMKKHASELSRDIKKVGADVTEGKAPLTALAAVACIAVLREGSEVVLFLYGLTASGQPWAPIFEGGFLGLLLGALIGTLLYLGLIRIPTGKLFSVTGFILIFLGAGMVSQAVGYLTMIGWLPTLADPLWDASSVISQNSILGKTLNALIGYTDKPTGIQVIFYSLTVGGMFMLLQWVGKGSKRSTGVVAVIVLAGLLGWSADAHATKKVYSPLVEYRELEIEYRGSVAFDDRESKDDKQKHKLGIGYGILERWFLEVYGAWENHPGADKDGTSYEATEIENKFQLSEQGEYFIDLGFMVENEFASEDESHDEVKLVLLLEKSWDQWRHRANPFMEYKYGGEEEDAWEAGVSWSTTYRAQTYFEPGFEIHWAYENVEESLTFEQQDFQIGPAVYGKIGENLKYDIGYLFGVSDESPDGELKWVFEYEWHF